ncbi:uncharacterized protein LACBIDRAFT_299415 [Laccaria bicolor S238N-H82]|uniref:Predicted protein n=1 Tax=Laccaria bicolor (strain S238N-H82 / ATCC MYA-4686) TaxID=486041 RepID=B0DEN1_LACBS|nr:uncharacterized protein LACBIDRAFT_299415 [Laccaria bicolor S238N-H82]EDR06967.1 predicted protein [Laccaria bicolor S238N-H82]|eukprot:XP_001882340.1 predicted protein [Laccaria bicolor S238N-H82]
MVHQTRYQRHQNLQPRQALERGRVTQGECLARENTEKGGWIDDGVSTPRLLPNTTKQVSSVLECRGPTLQRSLTEKCTEASFTKMGHHCDLIWQRSPFDSLKAFARCTRRAARRLVGS